MVWPWLAGGLSVADRGGRTNSLTPSLTTSGRNDCLIFDAAGARSGWFSPHASLSEALGYLLMLRGGVEEKRATRANLLVRFERILKDLGDCLPFDGSAWAEVTVVAYNGLKHANRAAPDEVDVMNARAERPCSYAQASRVSPGGPGGICRGEWGVHTSGRLKEGAVGLLRRLRSDRVGRAPCPVLMPGRLGLSRPFPTTSRRRWMIWLGRAQEWLSWVDTSTPARTRCTTSTIRTRSGLCIPEWSGMGRSEINERSWTGTCLWNCGLRCCCRFVAAPDGRPAFLNWRHEARWRPRPMKDFHRRLAVVALRVLEPYGFVLAGGYAISAHGMGARPSMDVDLFTASTDPQQFNEAVARLRSALAGAGLVVTDNRMRPLFADLTVADPISGESSDLQLGMNYRQYPPHVVEIGPVLDVRDAVAGKMSALWSRGEARDFIDIHAVLQSGRSRLMNSWRWLTNKRRRQWIVGSWLNSSGGRPGAGPRSSMHATTLTHPPVHASSPDSLLGPISSRLRRATRGVGNLA